jgi:hypothetical protein
MKKFTMFALMALLSISAGAATLSDTITSTLDLTLRQDQSTYARFGGPRMGLIVRSYDFDVDGGAIGTINLGAALPDGALIVNGWVDVIEETDSDVSEIGLTGDTDALLADTGLDSVAVVLTIPDTATVGDSVEVTDSSTYVTLTIGTSATTQGAFTLYLQYIQLNP